MITQLEKLTEPERRILFKTPALISVLAASEGKGINQEQKADAVKMAHLKTFTADPILRPYYEEVEKHFLENFESIAKRYMPFTPSKRNLLKQEIHEINHILPKLDKEFAELLHQSLNDYERHVKRAVHSVLGDFVFPLPIHGLTDI